LTDLSVGCPSLSFLGVHFLSELKLLERLSLAGSGATDSSLKSLYGLAGLRELDLSGTKVTDDGIADLQKVLPDCKVRRANTTKDSARP
jgi:hypothetical protein